MLDFPTTLSNSKFLMKKQHFYQFFKNRTISRNFLELILRSAFGNRCHRFTSEVMNRYKYRYNEAVIITTAVIYLCLN